jgi:hypothetical protein
MPHRPHVSIHVSPILFLATSLKYIIVSMPSCSDLTSIVFVRDLPVVNIIARSRWAFNH